jgi:chromosome partitioning protein
MRLLSAIGLDLLLKTIYKVIKKVNKRLKITGILMTMCDNRTGLHRDIYDTIKNTYKDTIKIFDAQIPKSIKVGEANLNHKSVIEYAPQNKASLAYLDLVEEVLGCE